MSLSIPARRQPIWSGELVRKLTLHLLFAVCGFLSISGAAFAADHPKQILFICTGNFYRSRFAEAVFNEKAAEAHLDWRAISRGINLVASQRGISPVAKRELLKCDVPQHFFQGNPRRLTAADLGRSDYVVLMDEAEHRPLLEKLFPKCNESKIHYWHIHDTGKMKPTVACQMMVREVEDLIKELRK